MSYYVMIILAIVSVKCLFANGESSTVDDFIKKLTTLFDSNGGIDNTLRQAIGQGYQSNYYGQNGYPQNFNYGHQQNAPPYYTQQNYNDNGNYPVQGPNNYNGYQQFGSYPQYQQNYGLGSQSGSYPPYYPNTPRPGFLGALESITRHDDLRCMPRLLCEVTSAGRPNDDGKQQSIIPFTSKESLISLLTVLNFVDDSPLMTFGRAALLGYTAKGDSRACTQAYPTCPRDPDALVDYLNNYNGGFFRYFNGQASPQYPPQYPPYYQPPYYPQKGYYPNYNNNNYYKKYKQYSSNYQRYFNEEGRIQTKKEPQDSINSYYLKEDGKTLVFPDSQRRRGKQLIFPNDSDKFNFNLNPVRPAMYFPDKTGTGALSLDFDNFGDIKAIYYGDESKVTFKKNKQLVKFPFKDKMNFPNYR